MKLKKLIAVALVTACVSGLGTMTVFAEKEDNDNIIVEEPSYSDSVSDKEDNDKDTSSSSGKESKPAVTEKQESTVVDITPTPSKPVTDSVQTIAPSGDTPETGDTGVLASIIAVASSAGAIALKKRK